MKVLSLHIRDFAGILEADIKPGKVSIFSGKNRAGKTSILNAVRACLEGADPTTIHAGTDKAEIVVDLEEIRVRRTIRASKQEVEVTDPKGFKLPRAPQAYLSSLLGTVQFNPMEFHRAKKADRTKMLLEAIARKVTFEEIIEITGEVVPGIPKEGPALLMYDLVRKYYYVLRAAKNKELVNRRELARTARAKVPEGYVINATAGREATMAKMRDGSRNDVSRLEAEKKSAERAKETRAKTEDRIRKNQGILVRTKEALAKEVVPDIHGLMRKVEDARLALRAAEEALQAGRSIVDNIDTLTGTVANMERDIRQDQETLAALPGAFDDAPLVEAREILSRMASEEKAIEEVRALNQLVEDAENAEASRDMLQSEADALDGMVIRFRDELPAQALREANLPIEGLKIIDGDDITVAGIPIDNLSGAEKMELAVEITLSLAANNPVKLICVDGIEQLDDESLAAFERRAQQSAFQWFVSRVGVPREGEIEIANGKVAVG